MPTTSKIQYLHYDENVDHLTIYRSDERIHKSIDTGLVLIGLNREKKIIGLEFMSVHRRFQVPLRVLKNLKGCMVFLQYTPENRRLIITVHLKYGRYSGEPVVFSSTENLGRNPFSESFECAVVA